MQVFKGIKAHRLVVKPGIPAIPRSDWISNQVIMGTVEDAASIATTAAEYQLSTRGAQGLLYRDVWGPREKSMGNPWSPTNPEGT
jgi:hypothetical protein